jgi:preprotein translocase subunit SecA
MKEDDAIEDRMVTKQIMNAQRKVEAHNFDYPQERAGFRRRCQ